MVLCFFLIVLTNWLYILVISSSTGIIQSVCPPSGPSIIKGRFSKFPWKVWLSILPVSIIMILVMSVVMQFSIHCFFDYPDFLWWFDYLTILFAWSLMFGAYVAWITAERIYYRQSKGME